MESQKNIFIKEMKKLFSNKMIISLLKYKIINIKEVNFDEYYTTLELKNECIIDGIFIKTNKQLKLNQIISKCIFNLDVNKTQIQIKDILSIENIENDLKTNKTEITKFNLKPEKILEFFSSIKCFKEKTKYDNIFIVFKSKNEFILENPVTLEKYTINEKYFKNISDIKDKDFVYLKNYLYNKNDEIICIDLTKVQKASDYIIFKNLDNYITSNYLNDVYEFKPIKDSKIIDIKFLFSKVVLKNQKKEYLIIIDKFNRLIEIDYNKFKNLDLFDLLFITNCKIQKSEKDEFIYKLFLKENSLYYYTKELIFNKNISINNFTVLDIRIPDFSANNNFFNKIIICNNYELEIKKNRIVCIFKFKNEQFNEIVPYNIICLDKSKDYEFKFLITHNLINNINLFINYKGEDRCCIEHCYWNFVDTAPDSYSFIINNHKYEINHSNSFDSLNRVGFILINVPSTEQTNKIKNETKQQIISSQIWYIKESFEQQEYVINQILDIEEAKPKEYLNYKLKIKDYYKYGNLLSDFKNFRDNWFGKEKEINEYYKKFYENVYKSDEEEINSFINENNIDFDCDSADYSVLKIYINILLFHSLKKIENKNKFKNINKWYNFINIYFKLIDILAELNNEITPHQIIRILSSFVNYYFEPNEDFEGNPCKFLYLKGKDINSENSYLLALEFNKKVINNLTERSALTKGYIQIDSYILKNYSLQNFEKSYTFSNEPIVLMKYHLLINYEYFLFISCKKPTRKYKINVEQDPSNRITFINEQKLFNSGLSEYYNGKNKAFPISIEYFHEKISNSKKYFKNFETDSPVVYYINKTIIKDEPKEGKIIESLIGDIKFIKNLEESENDLGELMEIKYFIDEDFNNLYEKYKEIMNSKNPEQLDKKIENKNNLDNNEKIEITNKNDENNGIILSGKKLETLEDFENAYLVRGYFVYPDSLPIHEYAIGEEPKKLSKGEQDYLDKYRPIFEEAKRAHLRIKNKSKK